MALCLDLFNRIASNPLALDTWGFFSMQSAVIPTPLINFPELRSPHATALRSSLPGVCHELPSREFHSLVPSTSLPDMTILTESLEIK